MVNKPGEKPAGGTYKQVGPRGGQTTHAPIHHKPGKPLPPTDKPGQGWKKVESSQGVSKMMRLFDIQKHHLKKFI